MKISLNIPTPSNVNKTPVTNNGEEMTAAEKIRKIVKKIVRSRVQIKYLVKLSHRKSGPSVS